jgi:hypothetical protein
VRSAPLSLSQRAQNWDRTRRMLKTWTLPKVGAAALAALLSSVLVAPAGAQMDQEKTTPDIYGPSYCVAGISKDPKFINLMDPNREVVEAGLSFAYKNAPTAKVGDLVKITPANKTGSGQPDFKVVTPADPKCKRFVGE